MANFSLLATLGLNSKGYQDGIDGAETKTNSFKNAIGLLGSAVAAVGLSNLAREAVDLGSKLSDVATQLNIDVEAFQTLKFAAQEAGVKMSSLERAIRNVQLRTEEAVKGNKSYSDAFDQLGIDIEEFRQLKVEDKFQEIADAAEASEDKAAAFNSVARILGERSGPELTEVLDRLAKEGFDEVKRAAEDLHQVMSTDTSTAMDNVADTIETLKTASTNLVAEGLNRLIGAFEGLVEIIGLAVDDFNHSKDTFVELGTTINDIIRDAVRPCITAFDGLKDAARAVGQALTGNFDDAKESVDSAKQAITQALNEIGDLPEEVSREFDEMFDNIDELNEDFAESTDERLNDIGDAFHRTMPGIVRDTNEQNAELERNFEETTDNLVEHADEAGEDISNELTPNLSTAFDNVSDVSNALGGVERKAEAAGDEIEELNEKRLADLRAQAVQTENAIEALETEIENTKQKILDLNQAELDELLAEFGTTAEEIGTELERQLAGAGETAAEQTRDDMIDKIQDAIGQVRHSFRQTGQEFGEGVSNTMPSESELERIADLMETVNEQSGALDKAPETVESLHEELDVMNQELEELTNELEETDLALQATDQSAADLSNALEQKAEEIRAIEIPSSVGSASSSSGSSTNDGGGGVVDLGDIGSKLDTSNGHLEDISNTLDGKFVNQ